jgi:serine/threonine protein kinase
MSDHSCHELPQGTLLHERYRIERVLGAGGFGITYLCRDERLQRQVCIKEFFLSGHCVRSLDYSLLVQGLNQDDFTHFLQRFREEALTLAQFRHPGIVQVLDLFHANHTSYYVMDFVEGETLKSWVRRNGPMPFSEALPLMNKILDALDTVHKADLLHRDLKPENIMLQADGQPVLIDFGSARQFSEGKTLNQTAILTPGFAPPEQYSESAHRGPFTDIYALGATCYFMLTGKKPVDAYSRNREELIPPHQIDSSISEICSSALMLAMNLQPEDRFHNALEFKSALNKIESNANSQLQRTGLRNFRKSEGVLGRFISELIFIQGGVFQMGTEDLEVPDARPVHEVFLTDFYMSKYPVTQEVWEEVCRYNPSQFRGNGRHPVENISSEEIDMFLQKLRERSGIYFFLPTEAEWEYAAKGGVYHELCTYAGGNKIEECGWYEANTNRQTQPVGRLNPNALGLHDMSGNVWEMCQDLYSEAYYKNAPVRNHIGAETGSLRAVRGGSWKSNDPVECRVTYRGQMNKAGKSASIGFRVVAFKTSN